MKPPPTILFMITLLAGGCSHVEPWERGNLAKPHMILDPHPMQSTVHAHNYGSREALTGTSASTGGGGCGCF